jgi:cysteine desulfurase
VIYGDYNGSAPVCQAVIDYLKSRLDEGPYSNPNAAHAIALSTRGEMENARAKCAKHLGAKFNQIIFNSGSTEGISHIFYSLLAHANPKEKPYIITSSAEHAAVVKTSQFYESLGYKILYVPCTGNGVYDVTKIQEWIKKYPNQIAMISLMAANNETGIIQPFSVIAHFSKEAGIPFLCDTTQFIGKAPFNFEESGLDFAVMSGHKIGALPGTGLIIARNPSLLRPFIIGGGQEGDLRGGTQNYIGIETMGVALENFSKKQVLIDDLRRKRDEFEKDLKEKFPQLVIFGEGAPRLANTSFISIAGTQGKEVQRRLERQRICVSTSSACSDQKTVKTSRVLEELGACVQTATGAVRISIGINGPLEYFDKINAALTKIYRDLTQS